MNLHPDVHASELIRSGRYLEAVKSLQVISKSRSRDPVSHAMLADVLQRIGQNATAEEIATRYLRDLPPSNQAYSHYHFVLGNVKRDRGNTANAISHLQLAAGSAVDMELACWIQVRLLSVIAEISGVRTAIARIDDVKRTLIRFGDPRPFVALHLWLVEAESTRGNLEMAWGNLRTAESLLSKVDDVWLRGYLAVNRSALHYYSGEIVEANRWALEAIDSANDSGHQITRRAAHVNLGNIQCLLGQFTEAEASFQTALNCSEPSSLSEVIILENIAQIKLHLDDFEACRNVLQRLEELTTVSRQDVKRAHYSRWALQTKIRLLLREGKTAEARRVCEQLEILATGTPHARVSAASNLLAAETFLAVSDPRAAAQQLKSIITAMVQLPPDLFAEMERVAGTALLMSDATEIAHVRLERAYRTFDVIGHTFGKERTVAKLNHTAELVRHGTGLPTALCLDRIRALIDLRTRPELFGHEAISLLRELECTGTIKLERWHGSERTLLRQEVTPNVAVSSEIVTIILKDTDATHLTLSYSALGDPKSNLTALTFQRVLRQIQGSKSSEPLSADEEIVWSVNPNTQPSLGVVFASPTMLAVLRSVKKIAPTDVAVLVTGETGTGKEVIARAIHEHSRRSSMPFLALNCAAVPKDLLESQLFGHRKGAFSGATENHQGIVRAANGGTLLLDEIGELPMDMQAKLLRFLEMSEVHPVGDSHPVKVNVRLLFATNGDLEEAVKQNRFRQDLFYRINVIPIKVPPLRERREEIPVLANLFAQRFAGEFAKEPVRFSSTAMELLILYSWPGNVRQLANEIRRLTALAESGTNITPDQLSAPLQALASPAGTRGQDSDRARNTQVRIDQSLEQATAHLETEMIRHALRQAGGRMSAAAAALGISRKGLYLKRMRLGITEFGERAH
jgi:DNA-binding NtrC family response regulator/tetratricopeptide (TPR) repeat protein